MLLVDPMPAALSSALEIRPLRAEDLDELAAIGREALAHPWSVGQLREQCRRAEDLNLVAVRESKLLGYALFRRVGSEAELLQLAVRGAVQRQGLGTALLDRGLEQLSQLGVRECFLEVRRRDKGVVNLYLRMGFCRVGLRRKYYVHPVDDAVIMKKTVGREGLDADDS